MDRAQVVACTASPARHRRALRHLAAALCGVVGGLYLMLLFLVAVAESGASENTYGAYLFLTVPYLAGAALLALVDRRMMWGVGAASGWVWAAVITGVEVVLLACCPSWP